jgi:hypothetical protein
LAFFLRQLNKTANDIVGNKLPLPVKIKHVHNGDEFLTVDTDVGLMSIRWSNVVAYVPPTMPTQDESATVLPDETRSPSRRPQADDVYAVEPGATGSYMGIRYQVRSDYSIIANLGGHERIWPSLHDFRQWTES